MASKINGNNGITIGHDKVKAVGDFAELEKLEGIIIMDNITYENIFEYNIKDSENYKPELVAGYILKSEKNTKVQPNNYWVECVLLLKQDDKGEHSVSKINKIMPVIKASFYTQNPRAITCQKLHKTLEKEISYLP